MSYDIELIVRNRKIFEYLGETAQCLASWFSCQEICWILKFLAKILAIILGKVRKILQDFSRSWKEIQENFWTS